MLNRIALLVLFSLHFSMQAKTQITVLACANTTNPASSVTSNSAVSGGNICANESLGAITSKGLCWSTNPSPVPGQSGTFVVQSGSGAGSFTVNMTGLSYSTKYYMRSFAVHEKGGTVYGGELAFTTTVLQTAVTMESLRLPSVKTRIGPVGSSFIKSGGHTIDSGNTRITAKGVVWSTGQNPNISLATKTSDGTGVGSYWSTINNLTPGATYFVRAYATNKAGTAYGEQINFTTPATVIDVSGNVYPTVKFKTQIWMAENLRTTKYNDGSTIPMVSDSAQWMNNYYNNTKLPMMCWYDNDQTTNTSNKFGALYNYYTILPSFNGDKNVCPTGWHVADEWDDLLYFFSGIYQIPESDAGGAMKTTGTEYWRRPISDATNFSGLSCLPGGFRDFKGVFQDIMISGNWFDYCSKCTYQSAKLNILSLKSQSNSIFSSTYYLEDTYGNNYSSYNGLSVRCVKD